MCWVWHLLYNVLVVPGLLLSARIGELVSPKLRRRRAILRHQRSQLKRSVSNGAIWFHAASMGELEQIKPLIRLARVRWPALHIVLTIFSPSAWREHHDVEVDTMLLLPYDSRAAMRTFVEAVAPRVVIFSRYDVWWNFAYILASRGIPYVIVNATAPSRRRVLFPASFFRCLYGKAALIITRAERHKVQLESLGIRTTIVTMPDSRIDQLLARLRHAEDTMPPFLDPSKFRIILGSTWKPDLQLWAEAWTRLDQRLRGTVQLVIVPHEPTPKQCAQVLHRFHDALLLSQAEKLPTPPPVVVVDRVGMLATLYRYAMAAYVGGGFGAGVHSLLEPAIAGIPIACGPRTERSDDADELRTYGSLRIVRSSDDIYEWIVNLHTNAELKECAWRYREHLLASKSVSAQMLDLIERSMQQQGVLFGTRG
ncbi:3-deoxy-D-manno-octulosonic acid transferase [bacterium HR20]|nr:3-deoxy-D-manno-octulosonic acid transferase [bacterium HR20]